jgi:hypothetical protein
MPPIRLPREKLRPVDYAVLFGGPALFLAIAYFGLMAVIGPAPRPNPVKLLQDGAVSVGASVDEAIRKLGKPNSIEERSDGTYVLHYIRTSADGANVSSDAATVEVSESGRVTGIRFDRSALPQPEAK